MFHQEFIQKFIEEFFQKIVSKISSVLQKTAPEIPSRILLGIPLNYILWIAQSIPLGYSQKISYKIFFGNSWKQVDVIWFFVAKFLEGLFLYSSWILKNSFRKYSQDLFRSSSWMSASISSGFFKFFSRFFRWFPPGILLRRVSS